MIRRSRSLESKLGRGMTAVRSGASRAVLVLLVTTACFSSQDLAGSVARYAEGTWDCGISSVPPSKLDPELAITAVITVRSGTAGRVSIALEPGGPHFDGRWRLDSGRLMVRWDQQTGKVQSNAGPVLGRDIRLRSKRIEMRGDTRNPTIRGDWLEVSVDRRARSVAFTWDGNVGTVSPPSNVQERRSRSRLECEKR